MLSTAVWVTINQMIVTFGLFILFAVVLFVLEKLASRWLSNAFGWKGVLLTGWVGTPIHEFGHLVFCWLFLHKVTEVKFYSPDKESGVLGYVRHSYNKKNVYQQVGRFFIGFAPLISGCLALYLILKGYGQVNSFFVRQVMVSEMLVDPMRITDSLLATWNHFLNTVPLFFSLELMKDPWYWLFLYFSMCVAVHTAPSKADVKGALPGFLFLIIIVYLINCCVLFFSGDLNEVFVQISQTSRVALALLAYGSVLSAINALVALGINLLLVRKL